MRTLIVDDERPARDRLRRMLEAHPDLEIVGEEDNGLRALEAITALSPDLVFLDIQMPLLDGFGVARALTLPRPRIIFATAYDEFALEAFEAAAIDYLVKPFDRARLAQALERARHTQSETSINALLQRLKTPARLAVKSGAQYLLLDTARIGAIVAEDHYSVVKGGGQEVLCDEPLDTLSRKLAGGRFMRVHRSAIVNLDRIAALEREGDRKYVAIIGGTESLRIPISRERLPEVKRELGIA